MTRSLDRSEIRRRGVRGGQHGNERHAADRLDPELETFVVTLRVEKEHNKSIRPGIARYADWVPADDDPAWAERLLLQLRSRLGLKSTWVRFELAPTAAAQAEPVPPASVAARLQNAFQHDSATGAPPTLLPPPPLPAFTLPAPATKAPEVVQLVAVGRGFGHGVGMSQWGALAMAQRGDSFESILRHYYRGTSLRPYAELARTARAGRGLNEEDPKNLARSR